MSQLIPEFSVPFSFVRRGVDIPPDMRPSWRMALLSLILSEGCRGGQSSLRRLAVLHWASKTKTNREGFVKFMAGEIDPSHVMIRFDPGFSLALDLAVGEKILKKDVLKNGEVRYKLGIRASEIVAEILAESCFYAERAFLKAVKSTVSETHIEQVLNWRLH